MSIWRTFLCIIAITAHWQTGQAQCSFEQGFHSVVIQSVDIYCTEVPEVPLDETVVCDFKALNAKTVTLNPNGELRKNIYLDNVDNGDNSTTVKVFMNGTYSSYVDVANPPGNTIRDSLICEDLNSNTVTTNFHVMIEAKNTEKPTFLEPSYIYTFTGIPENLPTGLDFTTLEYGPPITAEDRDNDFNGSSLPGQYSGSTIIFEIQGGSSDFDVHTLPVSIVWPYQYRAAMFLKRELDYQLENDYNLVLIAKNADDDAAQKTVANVIIKLNDTDNLDPIFSASYYSTTVQQNMVTVPSIYKLLTNPTIAAFDQDTGINQPLEYAIDTDCGASPECNIVKQFFKIEPTSGELYFVSYGHWSSPITTVSFLITATQTDNPNKTANAEVVTNIDVPQPIAQFN